MSVRKVDRPLRDCLPPVKAFPPSAQAFPSPANLGISLVHQALVVGVAFAHPTADTFTLPFDEQDQIGAHPLHHPGPPRYLPLGFALNSTCFRRGNLDLPFGKFAPRLAVLFLSTPSTCLRLFSIKLLSECTPHAPVFCPPSGISSFFGITPSLFQTVLSTLVRFFQPPLC